MPPRKAPDRRHNSHTQDLGKVVAPNDAPPTPDGLGPAARGAWERYWGDSPSGSIQGADMTLALRWIRNLHRYAVLIAQADAEPIVAGSMGQKRSNPIYDLAMKLESSIRADEQQLGIGPLNRLRLGMVIGESTKALSDLEGEASSEDDPRLSLVGPAR